MSIINRAPNKKVNKTNSSITLDRIKAQSFNEESEEAGLLTDLPIDKIIPDPDQPRKKIINIENLAQTIKENELIQPIVVRRFSDKYMIVAGERRYHAFVYLKRKTIPCIIKTISDDNNVLVLQLLENDQREQMQPLEMSSAINALRKNNNLTVTQISKKLGVSKDWVSLRKQLIQVDDKIKNLTIENIVHDVRTLVDLNRLNKINSQACDILIDKIYKNKIKGSYRDHVKAEISKANKLSLQQEKDIKTLKEIEYIEDLNDRIIIKIYGQKQSQVFIKANSYHYKKI